MQESSCTSLTEELNEEDYVLNGKDEATVTTRSRSSSPNGSREQQQQFRQAKRLLWKSFKLLKPLLNETATSKSASSRNIAKPKRINYDKFRTRSRTSNNENPEESYSHKKQAVSWERNETKAHSSNYDDFETKNDGTNTKKVFHLKVQKTNSRICLGDVLKSKLKDKNHESAMSKILPKQDNNCYIEYHQFKDNSTQTYRMIRDEWMQVRADESTSLESVINEKLKDEEFLKLMIKVYTDYLRDNFQNKSIDTGQLTMENDGKDKRKSKNDGNENNHSTTTMEWIKRSLVNSYQYFLERE